MLKRKIVFISFLLTSICIIGCASKQHKNHNISDVQIFYSIVLPDTVHYTIIANSIPQNMIHNHYFIHSFTVKVKEVDKAFKTPFYRDFVPPHAKTIQGYFTLPKAYTESDTLRISLSSQNNTFIIHSSVPFISPKSYISSNNTIWNLPYIYIGETYSISTATETIYIIHAPSNDTAHIRCTLQHCAFTPLREGAYFIYDSLHNYPIAIYSGVSRSFPYKNFPKEMIQNLSIVFTSVDVDSLQMTFAGPKIELDKFWLNLCSHDEIATKNSIKEFYTRIEQANLSYTTACYEGAQTDKGYALMLFGEPVLTTLNNDTITWHYDKDKHNPTKNIQFLIANDICKTENLIKDDVFLLREKQATLHWEQCKIFNLKQVR